jgi:hypothetical protein
MTSAVNDDGEICGMTDDEIDQMHHDYIEVMTPWYVEQQSRPYEW